MLTSDMTVREEMRMTIRKLLDTTGTLEVGSTIRTNHVGCTAGEDTRARLYITRPIDTRGDMILGYCHNCGVGTGVHFKGSSRTVTRKVPGPKGTDEAAFVTTLALSTDVPELWHPDAEAWVASGGCRHQVLAGIGYRYNPANHTVLIPLWDLSANLVGYQARNLGSYGPKYTTIYEKAEKKGTGFTWHGLGMPGNDNLVIVEDGLSAWRLFQINTYASFALGGNNISSDMLHKLLKKFNVKKVLVALDNDSDTIRDNARSIARRCQSMGVEAKALLDYTDPKHWTKPEAIDRLAL